MRMRRFVLFYSVVLNYKLCNQDLGASINLRNIAIHVSIIDVGDFTDSLITNMTFGHSGTPSICQKVHRKSAFDIQLIIVFRPKITVYRMSFRLFDF